MPSVPEIGVLAGAEELEGPAYVGADSAGAVVENEPLRFPSVPEIGVVAFAELTGIPLGAVTTGVVVNWSLRFPSVPETEDDSSGGGA